MSFTCAFSSAFSTAFAICPSGPAPDPVPDQFGTGGSGRGRQARMPLYNHILTVSAEGHIIRDLRGAERTHRETTRSERELCEV